MMQNVNVRNVMHIYIYIYIYIYICIIVNFFTCICNYAHACAWTVLQSCLFMDYLVDVKQILQKINIFAYTIRFLTDNIYIYSNCLFVMRSSFLL